MYRDDQDRLRFLELLARAIQPFGLFEDRFKSVLVERENHLLTLSRYIALNPVKAGMIDRPEDYRWQATSARRNGSLQQRSSRGSLRSRRGLGSAGEGSGLQSSLRPPCESMRFPSSGDTSPIFSRRSRPVSKHAGRSCKPASCAPPFRRNGNAALAGPAQYLAGRAASAFVHRATAGAHLLLAFDGPPYEAKVAGRTARKLQELPLGSSPGRRWSRQRFMHPYLRDALMDMGYASLFFTVIHAARAGEEEQQWRAFKSAVSEAIVNQGGTISHHHGIGTGHRPWLPRERGPLAVDMLKGIKRLLDPFGIMNPEKLI